MLTKIKHYFVTEYYIAIKFLVTWNNLMLCGRDRKHDF